MAWQLAARGQPNVATDRLEKFATKSTSQAPAPYARPYPPLLSDTPGRWLQRTAPPATVVENLVRQLHGYLERDGFAWLAACAVYPEVAWPVSMRMTQALPELVRRPDRVAVLLPALARLPWFRHGSIPDWLRLTLVGLLDPVHKRVVHRSLEGLLEQAAEAMLAGRRERGLDIAAWIGPMDVLRTEPAGSPLRDTVFIGFLSRVNQDALCLLAPSSLGRLFRRLHSLPAVGETLRTAGGWLGRMLGRLRGWLLDRPVLGRTLVAGALGLAVAGLLATLLTRPVEQTLAAEAGGFTAMALSQDGRRLAAASTDSLARVWDLTGRHRSSPPRLLGLRLDVAEKALARAGLRLGAVTTQTTAGRIPAGTVISQSPRPGTELMRGSSVSLQVQGTPVPERKPVQGWCCIVADQASQRQQPGGVYPMDAKECQSRGGLHYTDEVRALEECEPVWAETTSHPMRRRNIASRPIDAVRAAQAIDHLALAWNGCCKAVRSPAA